MVHAVLRRLLFAIIALTVFISPLFATFAFVNANNAVAAAVNSITVSLTVTAGNMVSGMVTWDNALSADLRATNPITDNGTGGTCVVVQKTPDNGNGEGNADFYCYGWSVGPTTITATFRLGDTPAISGITVQQHSGQVAGDPIDGTNFQSQLQATPGTGTDGAKSGTGTLTPSAANYLVTGFGVNTGALNNSGASEFTAGTNFTEGANSEHQVNGDLSFTSEYWIQTTATAANASFTVTQNTAHVTFMMIFKGTGGGGSTISASGPLALTGVGR